MSDWHNRSHCNHTHVDEGVLRYFYDVLGCRSMLDIGCGPGGHIMCAADAVRYEVAHGIDGDPEFGKNDWFAHSLDRVRHDFLEGPFSPVEKYDLAWCCEFLEHIPEDKLDNVWPCFDACRYAAITAHPPTGVENEFHFNEQGGDYWITKFKDRGWAHQPTITLSAQAASTMKRDFFRGHGLVFFNPNWSVK